MVDDQRTFLKFVISHYSLSAHLMSITNKLPYQMMELVNEAHYSLVFSIKLLSVRTLYLNICNFCYLCNFLLVIMYTIQCNWALPVFNNK